MGWPPSRQLELSAEDGLECTCTAHGLSPGDGKQIQQLTDTSRKVVQSPARFLELRPCGALGTPMSFTMALDLEADGVPALCPTSKNQMVGRSKGDIPLPKPALLQQLKLYAEVWEI